MPFWNRVTLAVLNLNPFKEIWRKSQGPLLGQEKSEEYLPFTRSLVELEADQCFKGRGFRW